jgi:hypothetical protein
MDSVTQAWVSVNPGAAYAAGLDVEVEAVLEIIPRAAATHRLIASGTLNATDAAGAAVLDSVAAQAEAMRPLQPLRETLEWVRALIYLQRLGGPHAERADIRLSQGFEGLVRDAGEGTPSEAILARGFVRATTRLASDAGLHHLAAAAGRADALLANHPIDPDWTTIAPLSTSMRGALTEASYASLLRRAYGIATPIPELERRVAAALDDECRRLRELAAEVATAPDFGDVGRSAELVMQTLERRRSFKLDALDAARAMTRASLTEIDRELIALDAEDRAVAPEATPAAMISLVTEGEEYLAGGLTRSPVAHCFITPAKCGSAYTLANVLFHELAHCWNMLKSSRAAADLPAPLRVAGTLGTAVLEGLATRREREVFELFREAGVESPYARIFGGLGVDRNVATREFAFDTSYWWVARLVRALFDFRVQTGRQNYGEFVREASASTGLSLDRIHAFCFSFFERPGYAPCYAIGAILIDDLAGDLAAAGLSRRDFNTRLASIGMVPPAMWRSRVLAAASP